MTRGKETNSRCVLIEPCKIIDTRGKVTVNELSQCRYKGEQYPKKIYISKIYRKRSREATKCELLCALAIRGKTRS